MKFNQPIPHLVRIRFSCRTYQSTPLSKQHLKKLDQFIASCGLSPFDSRPRFKIIAAKESDSQALRGLGTYGFIKNPAGFIIGACQDLSGSLIDFGFTLESIVLKATDLGLGTCWLGGTFRKSRFEKEMDLTDGEIIPSVVSFGHPADGQAWMDRISRLYAGADRRLSWNELFFYEEFGNPLSKEAADQYQEPLEAVRLAPSASNRQPWRVIHSDRRWHFYLQRTPNYPSPLFDFLIGLADLQMIDLGIAISHFELTAREIGLKGGWIQKDPGLSFPEVNLQYISSWQVEL